MKLENGNLKFEMKLKL